MISYAPTTYIKHALFRKQDRLGIRRPVENSSCFHDDREGPSIRKELDFSQSLDVSQSRPRASSIESNASSFLTSVQVVPTSTGKYHVYPGSHDNQPRTGHGSHGNSKNAVTQSLLFSRNYGHNISNPDFSRQRLENDLDLRREQVQNWREYQPVGQTGVSSRPPASRHSGLHSRHSGTQESRCTCDRYHCHTFKGFQRMALPIMEVPEVSNIRDQHDVKVANENHLTICNTFYKVYLVCSEYKHGDRIVDFKSLWPSEKTIKDFLNDGVQDTGLRSAIWELCLLSVVRGPLSVLKCLLDLALIRIDNQFEGDVGLLHLACLLENFEAVQLLTQYGISPKLKDKDGRLAVQVCHSARLKRQLPAKYQVNGDRNKSSPNLLKPGLQDKDTIFKLATIPKTFYEAQNKLQMLDFRVNREINSDGDYLIHVACKAGLCQLPLLLSLIQQHGADIEMCNLDCMTPLMIIAHQGESNLCDIFMCLFGADPNKANKQNGKTALHYAVMGNSVSTVNCLLKRGADVNIEDSDGCLADDMPLFSISAEDCQEAIQVHRSTRCQHLADKIREDDVSVIDLRLTDLNMVDTEGMTLLMLAAQNDRVENLKTLLTVGSGTPALNAQHGKTAMTALAMASAEGHRHCVRTLLESGANVTIRDLERLLPLHHAVRHNEEKVVEVFLEFFPLAFVGLYPALKMCKKSAIHEKIHKAWERRQHEIVAPALRLCSMEGKAGELFCLLEEGDNVNYKSDLSNLPPLSLAVENNHIAVVKLLKEKGADIRRRDPQTGSSVLHIVARTGNLEMAKYLLEFCQSPLSDSPETKRGTGLDVNAMNNDKKTALQIAADKGYIKLVNLMISRGATTALLNIQGTLFTSSDFEGVRVLIETHRLEHTKEIMKYVMDKSKRSLAKLSKIWVPRFDHNLRDKNGDTPLMVVCRRGHLEVVKFLIESAVYAAQCSWDESSDSNNSDTDSGVPDLPAWKSRPGSIAYSDDLTKSMERSVDYGETLPGTATFEYSRCLNPGDWQNSLNLYRHPTPDQGTPQLNALLQDVERPKGLYIYHDGIVSHICAVNLFDGRTSLHRAIEGGDNPDLTGLLLEADNAVINMQDAGGLTPTHLACKLGRKKVLDQLLKVEGMDIGLLTLNGHLPEEMSKSKSIIKMMQKARKDQPVRSSLTSQISMPDTCSQSSLQDSFHKAPSTLGNTTINFDKVYDRYQKIRDGAQ